MFARIIKEAFVKWWDKMGYNIINSILGALNPFFLFITYIVFWVLWLPQWTDAEPFFRQFILFLPPMALAAPFFPTTFGVWVIEKRIVEYETIYFKKYLGDYFRYMWKWMGKALGMMLLSAAIGFLLSFSFIFYFGMIENIYLKFAVIVVMAWLFLFVRMIQFVIIPLWIYNEELKFPQVLKLSVKIIFMEGLAIIGIMALNLLLLVLLTLSRAFSALLYYGLSSNLRIFMHKNIIAKYQPKIDEVEDERLKRAESYQKTHDAWVTMMGRIEQLKKDKKSGKDDDATGR